MTEPKIRLERTSVLTDPPGKTDGWLIGERGVTLGFLSLSASAWAALESALTENAGLRAELERYQSESRIFAADCTKLARENAGLREALEASEVERAKVIEERDRLREEVPYFESLTTRNGMIELKIKPGAAWQKAMAAAMLGVLDAHKATNYVEQEIYHKGERYTLTFLRPGGATPHELRRRAEAERDAMRPVVEAASPLVAAIHSADEDDDWDEEPWPTLLHNLVVAVDSYTQSSKPGETS